MISDVLFLGSTLQDLIKSCELQPSKVSTTEVDEVFQATVGCGFLSLKPERNDHTGNCPSFHTHNVLTQFWDGAMVEDEISIYPFFHTIYLGKKFCCLRNLNYKRATALGTYPHPQVPS